MEENQPEDLTLRDLFREIQQQRTEVQQLRNEVKGNSATVASEVKKFKTAQELKWKFQGHKIQYDFNNEISDSVKQISWAIENGKIQYSKEVCSEVLELLKKRNKLIRIADSSTGGWETVRQYETNPVASDSDDESRIIKAESRALKRKRSSSRGRARNAPSSAPFDSSFGGGTSNWTPNVPSRTPGLGRGKLFRGPYSYGYPGYGTSRPSQPAPGPCFACGEYSHFRKDCPHVLRPAAAAGAQPQGPKL